MNFGKMFKDLKLRKLGEDEVGIGMDGKTYFKRKDGDYVRYDTQSGQIINTHGMKFDFGMSMIIPSPIVEVNDILVIENGFLHITKITHNRILGVDINSGRTKSLVKEASILGVNFYQKVVNLMDGGAFNQQQNSMGGMFGNMNPMMFAMMSKDGDSSKSNSMMEMMMMSQMFSGGGFNFMNGLSNNTPQNGQTSLNQIPQNTFEFESTEEDFSENEIDAEIERLMELKNKKYQAKE